MPLLGCLEDFHLFPRHLVFDLSPLSCFLCPHVQQAVLQLEVRCGRARFFDSTDKIFSHVPKLFEGCACNGAGCRE